MKVGRPELCRRRREGRAGRLHHAVDREVAARGVRAVVVEEVQQVVAIGVAGREQRRCVDDLSFRGGEIRRRHHRCAIGGNVDMEFLRPAEEAAIPDVHEQIVGELDVPAVKVVCASCASDTAKVVPAACTTPSTVKWPLAGAALLS